MCVKVERRQKLRGCETRSQWGACCSHVRSTIATQPLVFAWVAGLSPRQQAPWRAAGRRHPTGRERMGSHTLYTLQDPILLRPWPAMAAFQTLADRRASLFRHRLHHHHRSCGRRPSQWAHHRRIAARRCAIATPSQTLPVCQPFLCGQAPRSRPRLHPSVSARCVVQCRSYDARRASNPSLPPSLRLHSPPGERSAVERLHHRDPRRRRCRRRRKRPASGQGRGEAKTLGLNPLPRHNEEGFGFQRMPREYGTPTVQTLHDPILSVPFGAAFEVPAFQTR
jgi:hypothetical protein